MENKPEIIKVLPYMGRNNEVTEGRKTKISLYSDRLEYSVKYNENVKISRLNDEDSTESDSINYNEEDGVLDKTNIFGIVKYITTNYTNEMEAYTINCVDICSSANSLTFSLETAEDKDLLYSKLYNWKYGKSSE